MCRCLVAVADSVPAFHANALYCVTTIITFSSQDLLGSDDLIGVSLLPLAALIEANGKVWLVASLVKSQLLINISSCMCICVLFYDVTDFIHRIWYQAMDIPLELATASKGAGMLYVTAWFEQDQVTPRNAAAAVIGSARQKSRDGLGPGSLSVVVKRAINLPQSRLSPYVTARFNPGPPATVSTPVCTGVL